MQGNGSSSDSEEETFVQEGDPAWERKPVWDKQGIHKGEVNTVMRCQSLRGKISMSTWGRVGVVAIPVFYFCVYMHMFLRAELSQYQ